jgi:endonuclease YncB( thermonuclease family)
MLRELTLVHQATTMLCLLAEVAYLLCGPAARAQEPTVRDVTPPGVSRVFRNTLAIPDPEPPSLPQETQPPRILESIRPQTDGSLRAGALVFHLVGVQVPPTQKLCTTSTGARWTCGIRAYVMITNLLRAEGTECFVVDEARALARCTAEGVDVSLRLLELGLVELAPGVDDRRYVAAAQAAQRQGRGLWSRSP